jgi:predicted amidohydrolase YtcJ
MLIIRAELAPGTQSDVRIAGSTIVDVGHDLRPRSNETVVDARDCALLPGLHDHHVHMRALAAAHWSVDVGPDAVHGAYALRARLAQAARDRSDDTWIRAVGYHESVAGDLDRWKLDTVSPAGVPVRVQHRTGKLWVLNSAALMAADIETMVGEGVEYDNSGQLTGRLWRRDDLVHRISPHPDDALAVVGDRANALGITGLTDATPHQDRGGARKLARDARAANVRQRLHLMAPSDASPIDDVQATIGPVKVLLDDDALPTVDVLTALVREAHAVGRGVAFHCVTRVQLVVALAALDEAGATSDDRIEHGSVVPVELLDRIAHLGCIVVTQPHFVYERGDSYLRDVQEDQDSLYRCRSLLDARVRVAAGTDAPFGDFDPWASMAAAIERSTCGGATLGGNERVSLQTAVTLYTGRADAPDIPRRAEPGAPADLCLLSVGWRELQEALRDAPVRTTIIGGEVVFGD